MSRFNNHNFLYLTFFSFSTKLYQMCDKTYFENDSNRCAKENRQNQRVNVIHKEILQHIFDVKIRRKKTVDIQCN